MSLFLERVNPRYPHSPWDAVSLRYMETVIVTFVAFTTRMTVSLPFLGERTLVAQGSTPVFVLLLTTGAVVEVSVTFSVGRGKGVSVGRGVSVGVSVGGRGVLVGMAACVSATMVNAAATAVFCTSTAFIVGGGGSAPHALAINVVRTMTVKMERRFILYDVLLMNLAIGVTPAPGLDAVIFNNDRPVTLCNAETTECFEVLFAGDKRPGTVIPDGPREAISGDDEIATLIQVCHHIHGKNNLAFGLGQVGNAEICRGSLPGSKRLIAVVLCSPTAGTGGGLGLRRRHLLGKGW
jgi:hypothetical protein